jgi:hypothetical protein
VLFCLGGTGPGGVERKFEAATAAADGVSKSTWSSGMPNGMGSADVRKVFFWRTFAFGRVVTHTCEAMAPLCAPRTGYITHSRMRWATLEGGRLDLREGSRYVVRTLADGAAALVIYMMVVRCGMHGSHLHSSSA